MLKIMNKSFKFYFCIGLMLFAIGCGKDEDVRCVVVKNSCSELVNNPNVHERTRMLAAKVIEDLGNGVLDPEPILVDAAYGEYPDTNNLMLLLTMSDENFDIEGMVIRETHNPGDSNSFIIEEDYPVFCVSGIGHAQILWFRKRENASQRKDDEAWEKYLSPCDTFVYIRHDFPPIWISLPQPGISEVEIWIYDSEGNKSEPVPLKYGHPSNRLRKGQDK